MSTTACLNGPAFFKQSGVEDSSLTHATRKLVAKETASDGSYVAAKLSSASLATQVVQAAGELSGSEVSFGPGTLAIDTTIRVEEGTSLANGIFEASLGIDAGGLTAAGPSLVVQPDTAIDAAKPFSVSLSLPSSSLALADSTENLVVLYQVSKVAAGTQVVGVIPRAQLEIQGSSVRFSTQYFGSFQLAYAGKAVEKAVEATTTAPIVTKAAEKAAPAISWSGVDFSFDGSSRTAMVNASVTGLSTLSSCVVRLDSDKQAPWDMRFNTTSLPYKSKMEDSVEGSYFAQVECVDNKGRISASGFSSVVKIAKADAANAAAPAPNPAPPAPPMGPPLMISPSGGILMRSGSMNFTATGGVPPYTFSVTGTLANNGTITAAGMYLAPSSESGWVSIEVKDSNNIVASAPLTIVKSGDVDPRFGTGGAAYTVTPLSTGSGNRMSTMALDQTNGKIFYGGHVVRCCTTGFNHNYFAGGSLLLASGAPDSTFNGGNGVASPFVDYDHENGMGMAYNPNTGKLAIVGSVATNTPSYTDFGVQVYNSAGGLDNGFNSTGKLLIDENNNDAFYAATYQNDGYLVAAGESYTSGTKIYVARLAPDGSQDSGFNSGGSVKINAQAGDKAYDVKVQSTGIIIAAGSYNNDAGLISLNANGSTNASFASAGLATKEPCGASTTGKITRIYIYPDDHPSMADYILAVGSCSDGSNDLWFVQRFNTLGAVDTSFNATGAARLINMNGGVPNAVTIQPNNKILIAGSKYGPNSNASNAALVRLNSDGTDDTNFGSGSVLIYSSAAAGYGNWFTDVAYDAVNGRILTLNTSSDSSNSSVVGVIP